MALEAMQSTGPSRKIEAAIRKLDASEMERPPKTLETHDNLLKVFESLHEFQTKRKSFRLTKINTAGLTCKLLQITSIVNQVVLAHCAISDKARGDSSSPVT